MIKTLRAFLFHNATVRQTIMKNTLWLFIGEILGRLLRAIIIIYAARVLGAEGWGVFSYALTLAGLFGVFSDIGMSAIMTREGIRDPQQRNNYISTTFVLKLIFTIISALLVIIGAPLITRIPEALPLLPIIALLLIFDNIRDFTIALNRAFEKMEREAITKIMMNSSIVILGIFFLIKSPTSTSLAYAYTIGSGLSVFVAIFFIREHLATLFRHITPSLIKPILISAWPMGLMTLLGTIMISTDTVMLGWFMNASDVGLYSAALRPIYLLYALPGLIASAIFPTLARLAKKENEKFRKAFEQSITMGLLIALPIACGGIIIGTTLIKTMFGVEYISSTFAFQILLLTLLTSFPTTIVGNALFAYDAQRSFTLYLIIGALGNMVLNIVLIPSYGIIGCAIATLVTQLIILILGLHKMYLINTFTLLPYIIRSLCATTLMCALVYVMDLADFSLFLIIPSAAIIYGGFLIAMREPLIQDIKQVFLQQAPEKSSL